MNLFKYFWKTVTNETLHLPANVWNNTDVLAVIDMQTVFINDFLKSDVSEEEKGYPELLVNNIVKRIETTLNNNWVILLVESWSYWESVKEIQETIEWDMDRIISLEKNSNSLLDKYNRSINKTKAELKELKKRQKLITACWINTSFCISQTANDMQRMWFELKLPIWTTMNLPVKDFTYRNKLQYALTKYNKWTITDMIDFEGKPNNLELLSSYL